MGAVNMLNAILSILPFLVLCLAEHKINLNKANRAQQFAMPIIAAVYAVAVMLVIDRVMWLLRLLLDYLAEKIDILSSLGTLSISTLVLNTALVIGFIIVKLVAMLIISKVCKNGAVGEHIAGLCYEKDEKLGKWILKPQMSNFKSYFGGFYIALLIATCIIFMVYQMHGQLQIFQVTFYPFVGILILGEVVAYLSGMTKSEFVKDILGESEESYKVANYGMLREVLRELFGPRVLYENTLDTADGIANDFEELYEMSESEDSTERMVGGFYKKLKEAGHEIDINYVKSAMNLMHGHSTLFCNPFYHDLTDYIMLPMFRQLIGYKKCLVVLGRDSAQEDVRGWIDSGMAEFTGTDSLFQAEMLDRGGIFGEIGIIRFSDIHNLEIHKENREFLSKVGFVLLIEPSRILSEGQIGLSLLVNEFEKGPNSVVYCACDRNCDGLVDALSHLMKTSITEVTATVRGGANSSQMYWNADGEYLHHKIFPNISRYLGVGTEINAVAMKYQLEDTEWVGGEKFPVNDMKWIAGQYYKQICGYADLPESQASFNREFNVYSNLWGCKRKDNTFLVVEDEFQNLFEMTRIFASRAKKQGFINVISENYLLRDYMLDNVDVFCADPKAIPTIVPDFARTERNMVLRLLMMMVNEPVREDYIQKEMMLCGISVADYYGTLRSLILKHCPVQDPSLTIHFKEDSRDVISSAIVRYYEIDETNELYSYAISLKNAYYIAEDEESENHYIGSRLYGHIFQVMLPGQFITSDGKYYEVQTITPLNGVVVRRAADHISNRRYYRQMRRIHLTNWSDGTEMGSQRTIADFRLSRGYADLNVETDGYLEMATYGDFAHAKKVLLNGIPNRSYHNKNVLKIQMPGSSAKVRYTVCMLLNEMFRTLYPETYHYITAAVPYSEELYSKELEYVSYKFTGDCEEDCIYILEDSDIDLGLVVSVERNLDRYLEFATDFLLWHNKKMEEKPEPPKEPEKEFVPTFSETKTEPPKKGLRKLIDKIKKFFGKLFKGKKKEAVPETPVESEAEAVASVPEESIVTPVSEESDIDPNNPLRNMSVILKSEESLEDSIDGEDEELVENVPHVPSQTPYQKHCFLKFGYDSIDDVLDIDGTIEFLTKYGYDNNPLKQVREGQNSVAQIAVEYDPHKYGAHLCDFCGVELLGGQYELLKDGRERCTRCSMTAVRTVDDFKELYKNVLRNMEAFYGVKLNVAVRVRTTNAKQIAKHFGMEFAATPGFDGRVLGFAQRDKTGYSLYIENGSPRLAAAATIAHELTHIWQYVNWKDSELTAEYGKQNMLEVYEGMAKWAEIQYLMLMNEKAYAKRQEIMTLLRNDEYGRGFALYLEKYPLSEGTRVEHTPFKKNPPL